MYCQKNHKPFSLCLVRNHVKIIRNHWLIIPSPKSRSPYFFFLQSSEYFFRIRFSKLTQIWIEFGYAAFFCPYNVIPLSNVQWNSGQVPCFQKHVKSLLLIPASIRNSVHTYFESDIILRRGCHFCQIFW